MQKRKVRTSRVGEEHDETIDTDTPSTGRRETVFKAEKIIYKSVDRFIKGCLGEKRTHRRRFHQHPEPRHHPVPSDWLVPVGYQISPLPYGMNEREGHGLPRTEDAAQKPHSTPYRR